MEIYLHLLRVQGRHFMYFEMEGSKKIIHILPLVTKDRLEYPTIMLVLKIETDTGKGNSESRGVGLFAA